MVQASFFTGRENSFVGSKQSESTYGDKLSCKSNNWQQWWFESCGWKEQIYVVINIGVPSNGSIVELSNNGNFIFKESIIGQTLWHNFDHPGDTFLYLVWLLKLGRELCWLLGKVKLIHHLDNSHSDFHLKDHLKFKISKLPCLK